ncbi:hypothetical protein WN943_029152 [Citrus x changshan-huyou]
MCENIIFLYKLVQLRSSSLQVQNIFFFPVASRNRSMKFGIGQPAQWKAHFCGCGNDCATRCITCWLPCVTFGQIAEILDDGQSSCCTQGFVYVILSLFACNCLLSCVYRGKLRKKYGLQGNSFCDCCVHCFCETCALCQEHAELRSRGLDPSRGWDGQPITAAPARMIPSMFKK